MSEDSNEPLNSGKIPIAVSQAAIVRIPVPGTNGLAIEFQARGYQGSGTSQLFIQDLSGKKHLRLDYGFNKTTTSVDYHWNQKGTFGEFGITNHTPVSRAGKALHQFSRTFRYAGRAFFIYGASVDLISIVEADQPMQRAGEVASAWALNWVGCKSGGAVGAGVGTLVEPGLGTAIGGIAGCIVGGALGYTAGEMLGTTVYQWAQDTQFSSVRMEWIAPPPFSVQGWIDVYSNASGSDQPFHGCNYAERSCHNSPSQYEYRLLGFPDFLYEVSSEDWEQLQEYLDGEGVRNRNEETSLKTPVVTVEEEWPDLSPDNNLSQPEMRRILQTRVAGEDSQELNRLLEQLGDIRFSPGESSAVASFKYKTALRLLERIATLRNVSCSELRKQYPKFLRLRNKAEQRGSGTSMETSKQTPRYLSSTPSLRYGSAAGKVWGVDPIYAALLSPPGGIAGREFSRILPLPFAEPDYRDYRYDGDPSARRDIHHDAGGVLRSSHNPGPGKSCLRRAQGCVPEYGLVVHRNEITGWAHNDAGLTDRTNYVPKYPLSMNWANFGLLSDGLKLYLEPLRVREPDSQQLAVPEEVRRGGVGSPARTQRATDIEYDVDDATDHPLEEFGESSDSLNSTHVSSADLLGGPPSRYRNQDANLEHVYDAFTFSDFQDWLDTGYHRDYPDLAQHLKKTHSLLPFPEPIVNAIHNHLAAGISRNATSQFGADQRPQGLSSQGPGAYAPRSGDGYWSQFKSFSQASVISVGTTATTLTLQSSNSFMVALAGTDWRESKASGEPAVMLAQALLLAKQFYLPVYLFRYASEQLLRTLFEFVEGMWALGAQFVQRFNKGMEDWGIFGGVGAIYEVGKFVASELAPGMISGIWEQIKEWFSKLKQAVDLLSEGCSLAVGAKLLKDVDSAAHKLAEALAILFVVAITVLIEVVGLKGIGKLLASGTKRLSRGAIKGAKQLIRGRKLVTRTMSKAEWKKYYRVLRQNRVTMRSGGRSWTWGYGRIADDLANKAYESIRNSKTDVDAISRYTKLKPERIEKIKKYLFDNPEWNTADAQIAAAWHRLRTGRGTSTDKLLLKHETAEMWLRKQKRLNQPDAHRMARKKYDWESAVDEEVLKK